MNKLLSLIQLLSKRPSDKTIRMLRISYGIVWMSIPAYFFGQWELRPGFAGNIDEWTLLSLGLLPLFWGIIDHGIAQRKWLKKIQFFGVFLAWTSAILIEGIPQLPSKGDTVPSAHSGSYEGYLAQNQNISAPVIGFDASFIFVLLGCSTLISALTGKTITSKNLKYKEIITKIRV